MLARGPVLREQIGRLMSRVALIHALIESIGPISEEIDRSWPDCDRFHLLDDSLSRDRARQPGPLDQAMTDRFQRLADHAVASGAGAILFTCSAFGPCIDAVARRLAPMAVFKPNQAMIADAVATGGPIGLVATFGPTLESMIGEFPAGVAVHARLADGALEALRAGDPHRHDRLIAEAARDLVERHQVATIALAQFTMARAGPAVAALVTRPVLTTPASAVRALRDRLGA